MVKEVKSVEELGTILKGLEPGQSVTINYEGKEIVLTAKGK